jgi:enoyl-[acyl-carrier protein] reductase I
MTMTADRPESAPITGRLLEGKRALIMGVADKHSIAWGITEAMHDHGAELAFTYQEEPRGRIERNVRGLVSSLGAHKAPQMLPCDVMDDASIERVVSQLRTTWDRIDTVVHCVAYASRDDLNRPYSQVSREGYLKAVDISAYSLSAIARATAPMMRDRGGSLIALTYNAVEKAVPGYSAMAAAKAALELGVRYLAAELGPRKIRVNAISAGPIRTLSASAVKGITQIRSWTEKGSPLRENITPRDVGDTAVYLASDLSRMVTGNIIFVDSGTHILGPQVAALPEED